MVKFSPKWQRKHYLGQVSMLASLATAVTLVAYGCGERMGRSNNGQVLAPKVTVLPKSQVEYALKPCSRKGPIGVTSTWPPTNDEVRSADTRLRDYVKSRLELPLENYYRQYIGIIIGGKRVLYVNAFESSLAEHDGEIMSQWVTTYVYSCDGGDSFWGVEYYVEDQEFRNFEINTLFGG